MSDTAEEPQPPSDKPSVPAIAIINLIEQIACGRDMSMDGAISYFKELKTYFDHRLEILRIRRTEIK